MTAEQIAHTIYWVIFTGGWLLLVWLLNQIFRGGQYDKRGQ